MYLPQKHSVGYIPVCVSLPVTQPLSRGLSTGMIIRLWETSPYKSVIWGWGFAGCAVNFRDWLASEFWSLLQGHRERWVPLFILMLEKLYSFFLLPREVPPRGEVHFLRVCEITSGFRRCAPAVGTQKEKYTFLITPHSTLQFSSISIHCRTLAWHSEHHPFNYWFDHCLVNFVGTLFRGKVWFSCF